ncbi:hypothetical protein QCA50_007654 [Cerrena zonata]|uniref:F-box domain-containing protein n=1 Tax=Cerrena zonata TaxID=2478898 RepID=A0AAW0G6K5_9APHY
MNTISSIDELQRGLDHELRVLIPDTPSIYEYEKRLNDLLDEHRGVSKGLQGSLTKHHRIVAAIQARLNSFVPKVNSLLPPEILVEIFLTLSLICVNRREYYQWIAAAHVCRYWRDIILSCPQLFAHIWLPTL